MNDQHKKLLRLSNINDKGVVGIFNELNDLDNKIDNVTEKVSNDIEILDSKVTEAIKIAEETQKMEGPIGPQGPKGDKGDKGDTVVGPKGKDGINGKDGKDGEKGEKGDKGDKGDTGPAGKDGSVAEVSPQEVRNLLELLQGDERLDAKYIKNLPQGVIERIIEQRGGFIETPIKGGTNVVVSKDASGAWVINSTGGLTNPVDYIQFNTSATPQTLAAGLLQWNASDGTLDLGLLGGTVNLQLGQEQVTRVKNDQGSQINNGQVVYVSGADGTNVLVKLADADTTSAHSVIGLATENIAINGFGYITLFGRVRDVDTNAYIAGTTLYLSQTAGGLTSTIPPAPAHTVKIGTVIRQNTNNGEILVNVQNGYDLGQLDDVYNSSLTNGDLLQYVSANSRWENKTPATALGSTFLKLDQTSAQTITASPIFNWGTSGRIPFYSSTKKLTDSSSLFYDSANTRIGLGTASPARQFHQEGGKFLVNSNDGGWGQIQLVNPIDGEVSVVFASKGTVNSGYSLSSDDDGKIWAFGIGSYSQSNTSFIIGNNSVGGPVLELTRDGYAKVKATDYSGNAIQVTGNDTGNPVVSMGTVGSSGRTIPQISFYGIDNYTDGFIGIFGFFDAWGSEQFQFYSYFDVNSYTGQMLFTATGVNKGLQIRETGAIESQSSGTTINVFDDGFGNMGLGNLSPSYKFDLIAESSLFRAGYNTSNYFTASVSSAGAVTFDAVGSSAGFTFSDAVTVNNGNIGINNNYLIGSSDNAFALSSYWGLSQKNTGVLAWSSDGNYYGTRDLFITRSGTSTLRISSDGSTGSANVEIQGKLTVGGAIVPASMTNTSAPNNSIYYSTTNSKLVYKDSGGTVNNLY